MNPLMLIDGYKLDHRRQYPEGTEYVYSNWTPRESRVANQDKVIFLGLQYFLQKYLEEDIHKYFFERRKDRILSEYKTFMDNYLGPNNVGVEHIAELWELGYIPLVFKALPEGTAVPLRVPMLTVENTHPDFFWLVNYFETLMSSCLWMPSTSATAAWRMRKTLDSYAMFTDSPPEFVDWQGHDFSMRGMAGPEAAMLSGLGHLAFFSGTDTIPAIELIDNYYPSWADNVCLEPYAIGGSVPATEHSVMCAGGKESELETFSRLLDLYPSGIVSVVSDTWDLWHVLTSILPALKDKIVSRDGKIVIRPDSGDPADIVCGDPKAVPGSPAYKGVIQLLDEVFGHTSTTTGHKLVNSHVGCIYGDSITHDRAHEILWRLDRKGYASANMVFGVGSYTYQYVTRDTYGFAMKATWAQINGEAVDMFKQPATDSGMKNSAKGRLAVLRDERGELTLVNQATPEQEAQSLLRPVWSNGNFVEYVGIGDVRMVARAQ
jgi:nicotinamide phosphoribosyltransferase